MNRIPSDIRVIIGYYIHRSINNKLLIEIWRTTRYMFNFCSLEHLKYIEQNKQPNLVHLKYFPKHNRQCIYNHKWFYFIKRKESKEPAEIKGERCFCCREYLRSKVVL
jgi:hypothetical protein